jgi:hypothetical protein
MPQLRDGLALDLITTYLKNLPDRDLHPLWD